MTNIHTCDWCGTPTTDRYCSSACQRAGDEAERNERRSEEETR